MEIRRTKLKDLKDLPELYRQNYNGETNAKTDEKCMMKKFKKLVKKRDYIFLSAVEGEKLIGFCEGVLNYEIIENQRPVLTIWNMRVLPEYRKKGIGAKIMAEMEKFAKENNAVGVFGGCDFQNSMGQTFYKKLGYREDFGYFKLLK